jgi:Restriction alleviation protein Lar
MTTLPCPFCGHRKTKLVNTGPSKEPCAVWIECCRCGTGGPTAWDVNMAYKRWNERREPEPFVEVPEKTRHRGRSFKKA